MGALSFLTPRLALYGFFILSAVGCFIFAYYHIKGLGKTEVQAEVVIENQNRNKNYEKRKQENNSIDDDALIKRYCRWVYDATYDECVSSYRPVDR